MQWSDQAATRRDDGQCTLLRVDDAGLGYSSADRPERADLAPLMRGRFRVSAQLKRVA
jgi:hypothetical protein